MTRHRTSARWAAVTTLALMWLGGAEDVRAADEIGLSRDGVTFTETLTEPLFDPAIRWVPGDVRTATFHVRNESPQDATVAIDVSASGDLIDTGDLTVAARSGATQWTSTTTAGTHRLVAGRPLAAGGVIEIELSIGFDAAASNNSQGQLAALRTTVTLVGDEPDTSEPGGPLPPPPTTTDPAPAVPDAPPPAPAPTGPLPGTGATLTRPVALAAGFFVVTGATVIGAVRRGRGHA